MITIHNHVQTQAPARTRITRSSTRSQADSRTRIIHNSAQSRVDTRARATAPTRIHGRTS